jgi:hypothetical protein
VSSFIEVYRGYVFLYWGDVSRCGYIAKTQERRVSRGSQDGGSPHSNDPEETMRGELWVGVTPRGWSPVMWIPVKGVLRTVKPRVEGSVSFDTKPYET